MDQSTMLTFILCKKEKTELINMTDAYFKKKKNARIILVVGAGILIKEQKRKAEVKRH